MRAVEPGDLERIARALGGRRCGAGWLARCPVHDDREPSLSLSLGRGGRLLAKCHAGCPFEAIRAELARLGLLADRWQGPPPDPLATLRAREAARARAAAEEAERLARARRAWVQASPIRPGGPADRYLRGRGLAPPDEPSWPPTIREGSDRDGPFLIAALGRWPSREIAAVQITRLTSDGRKRSSADPVRLTLGLARGAACRLRAWSPGRPIVLAEGLEDALAIALADPDAVPWACLGATNAARVALPERAEAILALDADDAGRLAAAEAARALASRGHRVRIVDLPGGGDPAALAEAGDLGRLAAAVRNEGTGREGARPVPASP